MLVANRASTEVIDVFIDLYKGTELLVIGVNRLEHAMHI
jgi:hypothetical protein